MVVNKIPLQNLVMKISLNFESFAVQSRGDFGQLFCFDCPSNQARKLRRETSPRTAPLQNANFTQTFALQKFFANVTGYSKTEGISEVSQKSKGDSSNTRTLKCKRHHKEPSWHSSSHWHNLHRLITADKPCAHKTHHLK